MNKSKIAPLLNFVPINNVDFAIVAGAADWIDTDVSGTTGTDTGKLWVIGVQSTSQLVGARPHGNAATPLVIAGNSLTVLSTVDATGHMDLYRNAVAETDYHILGYLEAE